ncbi:hypothetical protein ACN2XU_15035 [Primorskyibacter sp. 2E107]|uniref:hypothetical protein n=1 Tax=Primorskyibacter sp. 2E107 TaxID=3403458 RepID=UPI003AF8823C
MRKTLTFLVTTSALTAAIGVPAWSAIHAPANGVLGSISTLFEEDAHPLHLLRISGDDDDDHRQGTRRGHDDDDDDDDCDDEDDDEDDGCRDAGRNPAPAGAVAPPANGLFGNGAPPKVQMN